MEREREHRSEKRVGVSGATGNKAERNAETTNVCGSVELRVAELDATRGAREDRPQRAEARKRG